MKSRKGHKSMPDPDPYFSEIPWEIIYDDNGKVIGEVFLLPLPPKRRHKRK